MTRYLFGTDIPDPTEPLEQAWAPDRIAAEILSPPVDVSMTLGEGYQTLHTPTPPVLALEAGRLVLKVTHGELTIVADCGDGRWLFSQIVEKLIDPALLAHAQAAQFTFGVSNDRS